MVDVYFVSLQTMLEFPIKMNSKLSFNNSLLDVWTSAAKVTSRKPAVAPPAFTAAPTASPAWIALLAPVPWNFNPVYATRHAPTAITRIAALAPSAICPVRHAAALEDIIVRRAQADGGWRLVNVIWSVLKVIVIHF